MPTYVIIYSDSYRLICKLWKFARVSLIAAAAVDLPFLVSYVFYWCLLFSYCKFTKNPSAYQSKGQVCKKCNPRLPPLPN